MLPLLTYPLAIIGLITLPALAAIYLLRNRFRRRQVSSLMLWQLQERSREGGVKVQKVQLPFIFFLELLILALLVTAATGPRWKMAQNLRPLIVILDDSVSMQATTSKGIPRDRATAALEKLFRSEKFLTIRFMLAGSRPRLLGSPVNNAAEAMALLKTWQCQSPVAATDAGIALATDMGKGKALLLVVTDQIPLSTIDEGTRLQWWAFGEALPNTGFINAGRTAFGDKDRCLFEIRNFAKEHVTTALEIRSGNSVIRQTRLNLEPDATKRVVLNLPRQTPEIDALLSDDALAVDNRVHLLPPVRRRVRVSVAVQDEALRELIKRTLDVTELRAAIEASPELVIHDSPGIPRGTNAWSLELISGENAVAHHGPFVVDTSHPLAAGIALEGIVWSATPKTNSATYLPIISTANQTLLAVTEDIIGRKRMILNVTPKLSTIAQAPPWPVLFWNLLNWRRQELPGLEEVNYRPGTDVSIRTKGAQIDLIRPDGGTEQLAVGDGELIARTDWPGLYTIKAAEGEWQFAVNLLSAGESDLTANKAGEWGKWITAEDTRREYASMLWLFVLLALAAMAFHLFLLTHSRSKI